MKNTTGISDLEHTALMWLMWLESFRVLDSSATIRVGDATSTAVQWRDGVRSCAKEGIAKAREPSFDRDDLCREGEEKS